MFEYRLENWECDGWTDWRPYKGAETDPSKAVLTLLTPARTVTVTEGLFQVQYRMAPNE